MDALARPPASSRPPSQWTEEDLIQEATRRAEVRLRAQREQEAQTTRPAPEPTQGTPAEQPIRAEKTVLDQAGDIWKSVGVGMLKAGFETSDFIMGEPEEAEKSDTRRGVEMRERELKEASAANSVTMGISQFATGILGAGKIIAPIKAVQKLKGAGAVGRAAYEIGIGATAGAVAIDPHEERLSNLVETFPALRNPVTDYLAADPNDSAAEGRLKNALEGAGLDLAIIGTLGVSLRAYRAFRRGEPERAAEEISRLEGRDSSGPIAEPPEAQAEVASREVSDLKANPPSRETPAESHPDPAAPTESPTPGNVEVTASEAPRVTEGHADDIARTASPSGETNQAGGLSPDLLPTIPKIAPGVSARSLALVDISPEAVTKIVQDTTAELEAIAKYGSREAAAEAGQIAARSASLPWHKLHAPDGLREFMTNTVAVTKGQLDAIKGGDVLSDAAVNAKVRELADWYGEDPASLMGDLIQAGDAARDMVSRAEAAYLVSNRMLQETYDLSFKMKNGMLGEWQGDATKAAAELRDRLRLSSTIFASAQSIRSNTGRTMRRMRGQFGFKPEDLKAFDGMDASRLAEVIYSTKGDPTKLAQVANPTFLRRVLNEANFSLANSLLWLYPTHVTNIASNVMMLVGRPTEKLIGAVALGPKTGGGILARQALSEYTGTVAALGDAWSNGVEAFLRGDSILNPHNTEFFQGAVASQPLRWKPVRSISDLGENIFKAATYRNLVGLPTRALGATDEFFKTLRYRAYVQGQAAATAHTRGLKGADYEQYLRAAMGKAIDPATGQALDPRALREAQTATFQNELLAGTAGATIQMVRNRHPILTLILPFVKTPINALRYSWRMTPGLNLIQKEFREAFRGLHGAEAQAHAVGQMSLGAAFMGLAATLTLNGRMTGAGPSDPRLQAELKATGWQPYSYVFDGEDGARRYVPMSRIDPASMALATVANLTEALQLNPESGEVETSIGAMGLALAKAFSDRTFLQSIHQTLEALTAPESRGERWLGGIAANVIPLSSALRGANPDPYMREARSFVDTTLKNLPGYSQTLPPVRDVFGEPVARRIGITTEQHSDDVEAEHNRIMVETGGGIGKPDPNFEGVDLRDITLQSGQGAYDRYQELSGHIPGQKPLKEQLARIIRTTAYQDMPDGESGIVGTRLNALGAMVTRYRQAARAYLLRENAELRPLVKARQKAARGALIENRKARTEGQPGARDLLNALRPQ